MIATRGRATGAVCIVVMALGIGWVVPAIDMYVGWGNGISLSIVHLWRHYLDWAEHIVVQSSIHVAVVSGKLTGQPGCELHCKGLWSRKSPIKFCFCVAVTHYLIHSSLSSLRERRTKFFHLFFPNTKYMA